MSRCRHVEMSTSRHAFKCLQIPANSANRIRFRDKKGSPQVPHNIPGRMGPRSGPTVKLARPARPAWPAPTRRAGWLACWPNWLAGRPGRSPTYFWYSWIYFKPYFFKNTTFMQKNTKIDEKAPKRIHSKNC